MALKPRARFTQKPDEAYSDAFSYQTDAKIKTNAVEKHAKEFCTRARKSQIRNKFDADSRAFRDTAMSTMFAAEISEQEGLESNPVYVLHDTSTAFTGGYMRIGGVAAVTTAINVTANAFPVMRPGTWFFFSRFALVGAVRPTDPPTRSLTILRAQLHQPTIAAAE